MRFASRQDVSAVIRNGRRYHTPLGRAAVIPVHPGQSGRVLFSVPAAVSKKSSERNRIRRHLEAWAREHTLPLRRHYHLVVFVRPDTARLARPVLRERADAMQRILLRFQP